MRIFFLRHAVASSREEWSGSEHDRPLTDDGRAEMRGVAAGLAALDLKADLLLTSPFVRAAETAHLAADALKLPVTEADELTPGASLASLTRLLDAHGDARRVVVVGHEPDFSQIIGELIAAPHPARLALKKGGCARVDVKQGVLRKANGNQHSNHHGGSGLAAAGTLVWLLTPRQLLRIGGQPVGARTPAYEEQHA
jgi:phosphohistidine phosphatase